MKDDKSKRIILDLCGGTGAWSKPYRDAGYDVRLITLPDFDVLTYKPPKNVYGILAAPPCTEFSIAKTTAPRDFEKGLETVRACLEIIWECQRDKKLAFWALENPRGLLQRFLGDAPYYFEQWWFGGDRVKPTLLWGRFNQPKRTVFERGLFVARATHNGNSDWYSSGNAEQRAITDAGFAKAFMEANK